MVSLAGIIWGTTGPLVQLTVKQSALTPLTISAYRAVAAAVVLTLVLVLTGRLRWSIASANRHRGRLAVAGVLIGLSQLLFFTSVDMAGVSLSTVVCMGFAPGLLLAVTSARRRRLPSKSQALTVALAVAGLLLISVVGGGREHATNPGLGVLAALGAGACFAFTADVGASLSRQVDTLTITTGIMLVAATVLVPCDGVVALTAHVALTAGAGRGSLWGRWLSVSWRRILLMFAGLRSTSSGTASSQRSSNR